MREAAARPAVVLLAAFVLTSLVAWTPFPAGIQWSEVVFVALLAWWVLAADRPRYRPQPLDVLVALYLLGALPSFLRTPSPAISGLEAVKQLYLAVVYVVVAEVVRRRLGIRPVLGWMAAAAVALAVASIAAAASSFASGAAVPGLGEVLRVPYLGPVYRVQGTFLGPEYLSNFLAFALPLVLLAAVDAAPAARWRWVAAAASVAVAAGLTLTHGVGGLAAAAVFFAWPLGEGGAWARVRRLVAVGVVAAILAGNLLLVVSVRAVRWEAGRDPTAPPPTSAHSFAEAAGARTASLTLAYDLMSYGLLKRVAMEAFTQAPLTGVGLGTFHEETKRAVRAGNLHEEYFTADPHSTWLGRLAETGLAGWLTLLALLGGALAAGLADMRRAAPGDWSRRALVAGLVGLLVNSVNVDMMNFRFLWIGLALLRAALAGEATGAVASDAARA